MIYIEQSAFLPWLAYCEALVKCDKVAVYDTAQFSSGNWHNRNRIKTANGSAWLTVPVVKSLGKSIKDTKIAQAHQPMNLLRSLDRAYRRCPGFDEMMDVIAPPVLRNLHWLHDLNIELISAIKTALGGEADLVLVSDLPTSELARPSSRTDGVIDLCRRAEDTVLWTGDGSREYLDLELMRAESITIEWNRYSSRHPTYRQAWPAFGFTAGLSVVDAAAALGWPGLRATIDSNYAQYRTDAAELAADARSAQ